MDAEPLEKDLRVTPSPSGKSMDKRPRKQSWSSMLAVGNLQDRQATSILLPDGEGVTLNSFSSGSASIQVADRVIFSESKTDPVILPLETLLFLPTGLKITNIFLFSFHG